jgi:6-phosphofructokinase 1
MAGKTGLVIGYLHDIFIHLPISMLASQRKRINPEEQLWHSVLASTGQPAHFV